jgi:hypothetical protein
MPTQKTAAGKSTKRTAKRYETPATRRWSAKVTTDSTHPQKGLFLKSPSTIARDLATKKVSPKGPASGMRMLTFYINRAGKNLGKGRLADLQRAKKILSEIIASHKTDTGPKTDHGRRLQQRSRPAK